jgi:phospholipase/carboxylesterase
VLAGFSQGAIIALFAGLRRAAPPRGILSFSGALPAPPSLAHELANRAPVLLVHGEADGIVSVARAREAEQVLRGLDVPVQLLALPGTGHVIDPAGIRAGGAFLRQVLT